MPKTYKHPLWSEKIEIKKRYVAGFVFIFLVIGSIIGFIFTIPFTYLTNAPGFWFHVTFLIFITFFIVMSVFLYFDSKKQKDYYVKIYASGIFIGNDYKNEFFEWNKIKYIKLNAQTFKPDYVWDDSLIVAEKKIRNYFGLHKIEIVGKSINPSYPAWVKYDWLMSNKKLKYTRILSIVDINGFLEALKKINKYNLIKS